jgi:site-specific DNA recombinase
MPSTNGRGARRAVLYIRVSSDEQAKSGYSIPDQKRELRAYATREGYDIIEEIVDDGWSGASDLRPGLRRIMELAQAGMMDVVLAIKRNRLFRSRFYRLLWDRDLKDHGVTLVALDDTGNRFGDAMNDEFADWYREEVAKNTQRGKLQKARVGKVMAGNRVKYGFKLNRERDGLEVDEEKMEVVRRIFRMVGLEGFSMNAIYNAFEREGIPTPGGGKHWDRAFFRNCIQDDAYKPHTHEELRAMVGAGQMTPEVLGRLDPDKCYGIWWFNQRRVKTQKVPEPSRNGRPYRQKVLSSTLKPKEEWIAVPVTDAGIPRDVVDAARAAIKNNRVPSKAGRRFWQLSGGIVRCGVCGNRMENRAVVSHGNVHFYHSCRKHHHHGDGGCTHRKNHGVEQLEADVWGMVTDLLLDPERLASALDEMIEQERQALLGDPDKQVKTRLDRLAEIDQKRSRFQDIAAEGLITFEELAAKLAELKESREAAEQALGELKGRRARIEELERDKASLLERFADIMPEALDELTPEERNQVYRMLRLEVYVMPGGNLDVHGIIGDDVCIPRGTSSSIPGATGASSTRSRRAVP